MRFVATSDSHFDASPTGRLDETVRVHNWMVDRWEGRDVGLILHAGDVFEGRSVPDERLHVANFLRRAARVAPVLVVRGNHDPLRELKLFADLITGVGVRETPGVDVIPSCDVEVVALPWPRKAEIIACAQIEQTDAGDALRSIMQFYGQRPRLAKWRVLVAHAMVRGSKTSTGQPLVGCDMEVSLEDLALCEPDVIILGHIHLPQDWEVVTPSGRVIPVIYCGSSTRRDFGEMEEKSYVEVWDEDGVLKWKRVTNPTVPMMHVNAAFDGFGRLVYSNDEESAASSARWVEILNSPLPGGMVPPPFVCGVARLRVTFNVEHRDTMRGMASSLVAAAAQRGWAVTVDEKPIAVNRARAPEMAQAGTIDEKLAILWRLRRPDLSEAHAKRLMDIVRLSEQDQEVLAKTKSAGQRGGLRMRKINGCDMGALKGEFALDLDALAGPIVAVTGDNGSGKSTLLELLMLGGPYRQTATREAMLKLATSKRSAVKVVFAAGGVEYVTTHLLDALSEKAESTAAVVGGGVCFDSAKVTAFDAWSLKTLPPVSVLKASQFAAQGTKGFLGMGAAERKDLIQTALGIDGHEARAKWCRASVERRQESLRVVRAKLDGARARVGDLAEKERSLELVTFKLSDAENAVRIAIEEAEAARAMEESARTRIAEWRRLDAERTAWARAVSRISTARGAKAALLKAAKARLVETPDVRMCELAVGNLRKATDDAAADITSIQIENERHSGAIAAAKREHERFAGEAERKAREAQVIEKAVPENVAGQSVEDARRKWEIAIKAEKTAREVVALVVKSKVTSAKDESACLRHGCETVLISVDHDHAKQCASEALADANKVLQLSSDALESNAQSDLRHAERAALDAFTDVKGAERIEKVRAANAEQLGNAKRLREEVLALNERAITASYALGEAQEAARGVPERLAAAKQKQREAAAERGRAEENLAIARDAQRAKNDVEVIEHEILQLDSEAEELGKEPADAGAAPPEIGNGARAAEQRRTAVEEERVRCVASVERWKEQVAAARAEKHTLDQLEAEDAALVADATDLTLLAEDFGRNGLQALEVDAAGPELSTLVNEMLHSCYGTRWTVRLDTTRPSKTEPEKMIEMFDVQVTDLSTGKELSAAALSGGEAVIIGEAVSLALTVVACKRSHADRPTLVRDEFGAALSEPKAKAYVAMLRRAAQIIGAEKVLLVSHSPNVQALADSTVSVSGGRVTV